MLGASSFRVLDAPVWSRAEGLLAFIFLSVCCIDAEKEAPAGGGSHDRAHPRAEGEGYAARGQGVLGTLLRAW